jgi:hypothetical protein
MKTAISTKTFRNRSSATDVLRALGVPTRDYNLFIETLDDGGNRMYECKIELAKSHVEQLAVQTGKTNDADLKTSSKDPVGQSINRAVDQIVKTLADVGTDAAAAAVVEAAEKAVDKVTEPLHASFPRAPKINKKVNHGKAKMVVAQPAAKKSAGSKRTVSSVARELIVAGKTNDEVWSALQKEFKLDDSKKSYPAWYRRECKAKGLIK